MAEVRLHIGEVRRDGLPPVCAACGAPATEYRRRWFVWTPGRNIPFALMGTWRYTRVTLEVPFCPADRTYFARRWVPLLIIGLLTIAAATATYVTTDITRGKEEARALWSVLLPAVAAVFAVLFVIGQVVKRNSIRVVEVEGDEFTLAGVSDGFAAAIENGGPSAAPVMLMADDEPPVVMAVDGGRPAAIPRVRPVRAVEAVRGNRAAWLMLLVVLAGAAIVGGGAFVLMRGGFGGGSAVRLSNGRVTGRMGMLVTVRADYRPNRVDPNARYTLVVRAGGAEVGKRELGQDELKAAGSLQLTVGVLPNAPGALEGVIEVDKPGGREPASNVVRFR